MSKRARSPDQAAIDMVTVGTFLSVACGTYLMVNTLEAAIDKAEDAINKTTDNINAIEEKIEYVERLKDTVLRKGPVYTLLWGTSTKDEKRKYLGVGRPGGLLK